MASSDVSPGVRPPAAPLAVLTPFIGLPSETFVARHLHGLAPGRTVAVSTSLPPPAEPVWSAPPCHVRLADTRPAPLRARAANLVAGLRGRPRGRWRWVPSSADLDHLARVIDRSGVEVVLVEYLDLFLPLVPWLVRRDLRVFAHAHGYDVSARLRSPWWREQYQAYNEVDGVVTVSQHARERLAGIGLDPDRVSVIPCGVDVAATVDVRPRRETVHLAAVGRMVEKKAPLLTIEAFRRAGMEVEGLRMTMIGDGPLLAEARAAVRAGGLTDRVRLLGARPHHDVLALYADADVFVQHSVVSPRNGDEEGLPVGILEAMAAGLPVVSTRHAGIPEAVLEGVTGTLVQEGDVDGMAAALVTLARDRRRRLEMGEAGHAHVVERFSWERERRDLRALLGLPDGRDG